MSVHCDPVAKFNRFVITETEKHDVRVEYIDEAIHVDEFGNVIGGEFDHANKKLAISAGLSEDEHIRLLAHEFSHFQQWQRNTKAWRHITDTEYDHLLWDWLAGEDDYSESAVQESIARYIDVELECERMALELIQQWSLPIDMKDYCREANACLYFYNIIGETRKWWGKDRAYNDPSILSIMPDELLNDYSHTPDNIRAAIRAELGE